MALRGKFAGVPVEPDTRITAQSIVQVDDLEALHQKWLWEGIRAESLIFPAPTVQSLDDRQLQSLARKSGLVQEDSQFTFKRDSGGFTFVNFNFRT